MRTLTLLLLTSAVTAIHIKDDHSFDAIFEFLDANDDDLVKPEEAGTKVKDLLASIKNSSVPE